MRSSIIFFLTFMYSWCIVNEAFPQAPLVKMWDKSYGGTESDYLIQLIETHDNGFLLSGFTLSGIGGDKTQPLKGAFDYWILKTDSLGNKLWDKDFGGSAVEYFATAIETDDHGFLLGGSSYSDTSGDKTELNWDTSLASCDYWIVKTDSIGNKLWDKRYGSPGNDRLNCIQQTPDGGYILGGYSYTFSGGDKVFPGYGITDFWIVKIDALGNFQWEKSYGGSDMDNTIGIRLTSDGGYMLGGSSYSGIGGNKLTACLGGNDYWVIKTDSSGNKQWEKIFGGTGYDECCALQSAPGNKFLAGGFSSSGISGNKTQDACGGLFDQDIWIVQFDSAGNIEWDKDFGGSGNEELGSICTDRNGGLLFGGDSYSNISCNKTENNLGMEQTWVIKTDNLGNVAWDKTALTGGHAENGSMISTHDGCYIIYNIDNGGVAGDRTGSGWGLYDYWFVKYCPVIQANFTTSTILCPGTCTDFINLSQSALNYQWTFPGANPGSSTAVNPTNICYNNPGTFDVTLIATNATGSDTLTISNYITVYPQPLPQSITQSGDTLFAVAGASTYQWYYNGNAINGATDYFYVASSGGDFNVVATDANGCEVEAVIFNVIAGLNPFLSMGEEISMYPNPVTDLLFIDASVFHDDAFISVYNTTGEKLEVAVDADHALINCENLLTGIYFLEISTGKKTFRARFVKQ